MQLAEILLEWVAGFLLAVEAIKVRNLLVIRDRLAPARAIKRLAVVDIVRTCIVWVMLLFPILVFLYLATGWDGTGVFARMVDASSEQTRGPAAQMGFALAGVVGWLLLTWLLGSTIYWTIWSIASGVIVALESVEKNTHNGIVGIAGFVLFSISIVMKMVGL